MSVWIFLKVFGDACLFFSVMSAFPGIFVHDFATVWPGLLCGLGAALACLMTEQGKEKWRFAALTLPLISLGLADGIMEYVMLAPVLVYAALVILRGMLSLEYYSHRESFRRTLTIWSLAFVVLWALNYMESAADAGAKVLAWAEPLELGLFYMLSGAVLLRRLRLGVTSYNRTQLGYTLGGCAAAVVGVVVAEKVLSFSASSLKDVILAAATFVIGLPMRMYAWLINLLISGDMAVEPTAATDPTGGESSPAMGGMISWIQETIEQHLPASEQESFPWWLMMIVLVVIAGAIFLMLRSFRKRSVIVHSPEQTEQMDIPAIEKGEERRSNRAKIRKYYRDYLKMEQKRGLVLKKHHTSQDVLEKRTSRTDPEAAAELRRLYLTARYDESARITPEQVKQAKDAMKRSKGV